MKIKPKSIENEEDLVSSQPGDLMLVATPNRQIKYVVYEGETREGKYSFREHRRGCDFVYRSGLESLRFGMTNSSNPIKGIGVIVFEDPQSLFYIERRETE